MNDCSGQVAGDFALGTSSPQQPSPFSCLVGGTVYDDLSLSPTPHFVTPLAAAAASAPAGTAPTAPTATTAVNPV
jgi:hypothetical protein